MGAGGWGRGMRNVAAAHQYLAEGGGGAPPCGACAPLPSRASGDRGAALAGLAGSGEGQSSEPPRSSVPDCPGRLLHRHWTVGPRVPFGKSY